MNLSEPVKAALWYTICNVLNKGIALLSTPIFTRILTEEEYGIFSIFQSWNGIIMIFTSLNMFLGCYSKGLLVYKDKREEFTSSLLALTSIITIGFGMIYLLNIDFWTNVFELSSILMLAMFLQLLTMPALEFWAARERFDYKYKNYVIVSVLMSLLSLVSGVIAVLNSSYKVEARVYTDTLVKVSVSFCLFIYIIIKGKKIYNKEYWKYALVFNLPLIPHYLSMYVLNQSDRIMIGKMVGTGQAAYYSVAYTISTMMNLVTNAINNALTPYLYKALENEERKNIDSITRPIFVLVAVLCIITMVFTPEIIYFFAGEKYMDAIYVVPPIAVSVYFIFVYSVFSDIEYYFQKTKLIAVATMLSAILNLILNYFFIGQYGYYAAGYTTLFCYFCLALFHYFFYKKVLKEELEEKSLYDMKTISIISILIFMIMLIMIFTYQWVIVRYVLIGIIIIIILFKRKYVINIIKNILSR